MSYTLAELTTALTADEIEASIYAAVEARGAKTTSWKPGAVVRTIIAGVAIVLAAFSSLAALVARGGFLELATGSWLTLVARYVFGVERITGTFASGYVTLTNTAAVPYSGGADDLIVINSTTDATYRSVAAWSVDAAGGPNDEVDVEVRAVEAGSDSTSPAGDIDALVTTLSGVTVTNAAALVGTDEETDPELRSRCLARTGALSPNGPKDAYSYAARNAVTADGDAIGVTRVTTQATGDGTVNVWVATASGAVVGDPDDPDTDLGAVALAIYEQAEPLSVEAVVASATPVTVDVTYELWIYTSSGLLASAVEDLVEAALEEMLAAVPIGGHYVAPDRAIYVSDIAAAIDAVRSEIFRPTVTAPAADVTMAVNEVAVLGTVTPTIHLVAGG